MSTAAATYKVNLHCPECAHRIKTPLLRTPGVHSVDVNFDKSEVKVIGVFDTKKIHRRIEKISNKKVDIIKVEEDFKETIVVQKIVTEIKQPVVRSITIRAHLHCDECERLLRRKLLKHRGIYNVKSDMKAQTLTIEGTIEAEKLVAYIKRKVHKHAEILSIKEIVKKEVKEEKKEAAKGELGEKVVEKSTAAVYKKVVDVKEVKGEEEKLEARNTPYIVHYVYAPQWFSDENPNSCCVM